MDESDQDFVDLCSKLLKRVRKKPGESRQPRKAEHQPPSQASDGDKRRRNTKRDGDSGSQPVCTGAEAEGLVVRGGTGHDAGDAESSVVPSEAAAGPRTERGSTAKDKVLHRMQQFKRASPQRMVYKDKSQPTNHESVPPPPLAQRQDTPEYFSPGLHLQPQDSDEALAQRLQQELDREAAEAQTVDLEEGGLFFCQICQRDLSHMTPEGRTQHLNRCLDESEESAPAPPPPPPGVPNCPICGKKFKSQKSRSTHLKRCSSDMGVAPAVLLQAVQRQTEETQDVPTANTAAQTGHTKRKGSSNPGIPARKKPRKKIAPLDEDTMVALALSSSLLEQEKQSERESERQQLQTAALKWRPDTGKVRGKRKKGGVPRPPPLLLVQDAEAALTRLQERISALLLRSRAPSPPTPTRCPSSLPAWSGAAPLWQKSTLLDGASTGPSDFYTPELREFITPWESATTDAAASSTINKPESSVQPVREGTPITGTGASVLPAPSTPGTGQLPVGSQALLMDLMELAEDGCDPHPEGSHRFRPCFRFLIVFVPAERSSSQITNLRLSGFVPEESEEQADLCVSGFLPETAHAHSEDARSRARRTTDPPGADEERHRHRSAALSRLASDLSSMVNNPQLSDLQLQVDSGDVYFAHSFMVYARCPLLAEMVHESGFGVQEEGVPAAQRVLLNDVPGQAVFALLQHLYTASCSIPASLRPHVLELASRFDLQELQRLCEPEDYTNREENVNEQTQQAFTELLRSMWYEEDEEDEGAETDGGRDEERELEEDHQADDLSSGDGEISEEKVNEEELEEIYEFAATQRKREEETDSMEEEEEEEKVDEEEGGEQVFAKLTEPKRGFSVKSLQPNSDPSLDRSYSRLFSDSWGVYEEDPSSVPSTSGLAKTHPPQSQQHPSPHKPSSEQPGRTLLQSSASVVDDLSPSPPPSTSNLPIPGQSPALVGDSGGDEGTDSPALKREKPRSSSYLCPRFFSQFTSGNSSEDMNVVLSSRSPSPLSPCAVQNLLSYTQIKPPPILKPNEPTLEIKGLGSLQFSPDDTSAEPVQSHPGLADCSPEVSWLIPSTPLQSRSTSSSSTQTKSSMCRTQLFPKGDASSLSSSVFASPSSVLKEAAVVTRVTIEQRLRRPRANLSSQARPPQSRIPPSTPRASLTAALPCTRISTKPPFFLPPRSTAASIRGGQVKEGTRLSWGAFTSPPCLTLQIRPHLPLTEVDALSPAVATTQSLSSTGGGERNEDEAGGIKSDNTDTGDGGEQEEAETGEAEVAESSFQQSFMDEPPIAFNNSWGFDACVEANPGCFSLRLEDSGASSQQGERSLGQDAASSTARQPSPASHRPASATAKAHSTQPPSSVPAHTSLPLTPAPPDRTSQATPEIINNLLDSKIWDSWEEEEEEALPLFQRVNPSTQLKTPTSSHNKRRRTMVPITPLPQYSDMDTPELKNKLNRFGVRPLPKRQMILKLKEIHQYTHQLVSTDSEDEAPSVQTKHPPTISASCTQRVKFKEPTAPAAVSPLKANREEAELLSASQGSNTSSTAASEESERSNPELCLSSDSDSDGGITASQSVNRLQDRLRAVRSFILSDSGLYSQILQYQPLVLSQLQERLKAAGIRLGAAKLVDYLDSQCITFTTAKPGHSTTSRRRGKKTGNRTKAAGRKRAVTANI
ncbi:structure-specific endonuclease subunit SLX4 [Cottoperca gobio]|uniref:Structure-specific endonuclease subunit SLX4 n=1 Tax=Cottoperca gobio TaxID=56716 RepID=A0A6J2PJW9_COTGO|nr:structure-specific endonuclease subunit SLX4 [Cottoperca gobio]